MATSQPLAFAELGFGGILLVSAIKNIPLSEVFKHGVLGTPNAEPSAGAAGGLNVPTLSGGENTSAGAIEHQQGVASPPNGSKLVEEQVGKELESYLKRPLTSKEHSELKSLNSKGKL